MDLIGQIYAAAARSGLLKDCVWRPLDGSAPQQHPVGFTAPDGTAFDGLTLSTDYAMTYPANLFPGLATREPVEVGGVGFVVRELRAIGDGSEIRATLTRV